MMLFEVNHQLKAHMLQQPPCDNLDTVSLQDCNNTNTLINSCWGEGWNDRLDRYCVLHPTTLPCGHTLITVH